MISGFRREVDENCALLGYYAASSGNSLPTFRDNLSIPSSRVELGPVSCPETSVRNYHSLLLNIPEERSSKEHVVLQMYIKYNVCYFCMDVKARLLHEKTESHLAYFLNCLWNIKSSHI